MSPVRVQQETPLAFLTLTVSAVVVFAALLVPERKLTDSFTAHPAEMIVQAVIPVRVAVAVPVARVQTRFCFSLEENESNVLSLRRFSTSC